MEIQLLNTIASGGSVAVLSVIIFVMYRNDKNSELKRWQNKVESCIQCREQGNEIIGRNSEAHTKNVAAITKLTVLVETAIDRLTHGK